MDPADKQGPDAVLSVDESDFPGEVSPAPGGADPAAPAVHELPEAEEGSMPARYDIFPGADE